MSEETKNEETTETTPEMEQQSIEEIYEQAKNAVYDEAEKMGVSRDMVAQWKADHSQICAVPIGEDLYFVRPLTRKEWRDMTKLRAESDGNPLTEIDIEEKVAVKATVWPKIEEIQARTVFPAGIPTALANAAMSLSGFNPTVQPIVM